MKERTLPILSTKLINYLKTIAEFETLILFCPLFRTGFKLFRRVGTTAETQSVSSGTDLCNNVL